MRSDVERCRCPLDLQAAVISRFVEGKGRRQPCAHYAQQEHPSERKQSGFWNAQRPRSLLSGLLKCAAWGASYTKFGANRFAEQIEQAAGAAAGIASFERSTDSTVKQMIAGLGGCTGAGAEAICYFTSES